MIDKSTSIRIIKLSEPAQRALAEVGVLTLGDLVHWSSRDLLALHGVGPKTIRTLAPLLEELGLTFKA
jgi:DNA-directed RNA polymerase alpha subunit